MANNQDQILVEHDSSQAVDGTGKVFGSFALFLLSWFLLVGAVLVVLRVI